MFMICDKGEKNMKCTNELSKWIEQNNGFGYYLNNRFLGVFNNCEIRYMSSNRHIIVLYGEYIILDLVIENRSIVLGYEKSIRSMDLVQKKLISEYIRFFGLKQKSFRITQYNMFAFLQYMETVRRKIDVGFEKYSKLLEKNIKATSLG